MTARGQSSPFTHFGPKWTQFWPQATHQNSDSPGRLLTEAREIAIYRSNEAGSVFVRAKCYPMILLDALNFLIYHVFTTTQSARAS